MPNTRSAASIRNRNTAHSTEICPDHTNAGVGQTFRNASDALSTTIAPAAENARLTPRDATTTGVDQK